MESVGRGEIGWGDGEITLRLLFGGLKKISV